MAQSLIITWHGLDIDLLGFTCSEPSQLSNVEVIREAERLKGWYSRRIGLKSQAITKALDQALPLMRSGLGLVERLDLETTVKRPAMTPADWLALAQ